MGVVTCTYSYVAFFNTNRSLQQLGLTRHYVDSLWSYIVLTYLTCRLRRRFPNLGSRLKFRSQWLLDGLRCESQITKLIISASFYACKCTSVQVTIRYCTSTITKNVAYNLSPT